MRIRRWMPILTIVLTMGLSSADEVPRRLPDIHFEATPNEVVEAMLRTANVGESDVVYDLGCGDGRFVIMAAKKFGSRGVGIDIDPARVKESEENARKANVTDRVRFIHGDLFKADIREATVVTLFLLNELNLQLRPKLFRELQAGTRIVSHAFDMGDWEPDQTGQVGGRPYYYWVIPANISGTWRWSLAIPVGELECRLFLDQAFQEVSGKVSIQGWEMRIRDQKLVGDQFRFRVRYNDEGQNVVFQFKGRVQGDSIHGTLEIQGGAWAGIQPWKAERVKN